MRVSPHPGGHDPLYYGAVSRTLDRIAEYADPDIRAAEIEALIDAMSAGFVNGDLYTNVPIGKTREEVDRLIRSVVDEYATYRADNLNVVQAIRDLEQRGAKAGHGHLGKWSAILGNTKREKLLSEAIRQNPRVNITSGNNELDGTPWQQEFMAADDSFRIPGSEPANPNHDPQLPGFIPAPLAEFAPEGFTRSDPRLVDGLSGFPAAGPDWQRIGQLPPSTAAPSDPLVLKFDPMTGAPLPYQDNPLMRDPGSESSVGQDALPWLLGGAALGVAAPFILPTLPAWAWTLGALGTAGVAAGSSARAQPTNDFSGGVFAVGAPPYNPFSPKDTSSSNGKASQLLGAQPGIPLLTGNALDQETIRAGTFHDRFGNWPGTAVVATPPQPSKEPEEPAASVAGPAAGGEVRRLARVNASNAGSVFDSGSVPVPYLPSSEFNDRFGNWRMGEQRFHQVSSPVGMFADEPGYVIPPPIWGLEASANPRSDAGDWFSRWIQPLLRQD
ncbi:hypothetical protein [Bradyrhizobium manausense]|uniref:hypothetical protein n=1 Tax=Bradyrhizobium manausense TaxID=989370 RepID=UPI001BAD9E88|nr:hypothetical protein [Bradyrhizobium manausense]MBR0723796.1 hypothetical protein [Bradyrhizobium manausense]